jgi:hypothetical protein
VGELVAFPAAVGLPPEVHAARGGVDGVDDVRERRRVVLDGAPFPHPGRRRLVQQVSLDDRHRLPVGTRGAGLELQACGALQALARQAVGVDEGLEPGVRRIGHGTTSALAPGLASSLLTRSTSLRSLLNAGSVAAPPRTG